MYGTKQTTLFVKTYEDDISDILWNKGLEDVKSWMSHTNNMIARLTMTPDPTKGDPQILIRKLANRVEQMKAHLKKRSSVKKPLTLSTSSGNANVKPMPDTKTTATRNIDGSNGSEPTSPRTQLWDYAAPTLSASIALPQTLDQAKAQDEVILVSNSPPLSPLQPSFEFNDQGI